MSEPLIVMTAPEVKHLIAEAVAAAMGGRVDLDEKPLSVRDIAKIYSVDSTRVRAWCDDGMPHIRTGDVRGIRIYPSRAREWLEENRSG